MVITPRVYTADGGYIILLMLLSRTGETEQVKTLHRIDISLTCSIGNSLRDKLQEHETVRHKTDW